MEPMNNDNIYVLTEDKSFWSQEAGIGGQSLSYKQFYWEAHRIMGHVGDFILLLETQPHFVFVHLPTQRKCCADFLNHVSLEEYNKTLNRSSNG